MTAPTCPSCGSDISPDLTRAGIALHPICEPLEQSPDILATEMFGLIADAIAHQPRSLQTRIGPSEIGTPCHRRLGHKLAGTPEVNDRGVPWKPFIGTGGHELLADMFARAEVANLASGNAPRWHVEERVDTGAYGPDGVTVDGSCDLYDGWHGAVWDWKFTTRNRIREHYRPHGPGEQYRTQAHLYGRGWTRKGQPVRTVGVVFLTRDGEFTDRYVWHEPYDETVALAALERATTTAQLIADLGRDLALPLLPVADAFCTHCPWFSRGATDLVRACPGVDRTTRSAPATLADALN